MRRLRHLALLGRDVITFGATAGALWLVPVLVLLIAVAIVAATAHATVPYIVYTFF